MYTILKESLEVYGINGFIELLFDLWSDLFLILMIFVLLVSRMKDRSHNLVKSTEIPLSAELLIFYLALFFYNLFYICDHVFFVTQTAHSRFFIGLCIFLYYCDGGVQMLILLRVIDRYVAKKSKNTKLHKIINGFRVVQAVNYIFLAVTPFTGFIYEIDKNGEYIRHAGYYVWQTLSMITLAFLFSTVFIYKDITDKIIKHIIITATIIPLASLLSSVAIGINLNSTFIAAAAFIMFALYVSNKTDVTIKYAADLQKSKAELEQSNLKLLLAQIQPHFIYNSIMALQSKSVDNPALYQDIKSFGKYLRANLSSLTDNPLVSFKDELNNIRAYLQLETLNYGDRLKVEYDIEFDDFLVPLLSVEPLVENAVRYGIGTYEKGGVVRIVVRDEDGSILIKVTDDGSGGNKITDAQQKRKSIGIENVRLRLKALDMGELTISQDEHGASSEIRLKYEDMWNEDDND